MGSSLEEKKFACWKKCSETQGADQNCTYVSYTANLAEKTCAWWSGVDADHAMVSAPGTTLCKKGANELDTMVKINATLTWFVGLNHAMVDAWLCLVADGTMR